METTDLQKQEAFHLQFLRAFVRGPAGQHVVLTGGCNLRFFYGSVRYSEDMDLDAGDIEVGVLRERVTGILDSAGLIDTLRTYGIERIVPPNMRVAKQTATVQRFKIHLQTSTGMDLYSKVEFSRRDLDEPILTEGVAAAILAAYRMPPLVVNHYGTQAAIWQKLRALIGRAQPQARDLFDLYILSSQPEGLSAELWRLPGADQNRTRETIMSIDYPEYRDAVIAYLGPDDQHSYDTPRMWDEIRLTVIARLEGEVTR